MRTLTASTTAHVLQVALLILVGVMFVTRLSHQRPAGVRTAIELLAKKLAVPAATLPRAAGR